MITLLRREFKVDIPREKAWQHLARVEQWPSWAKHIKHVEMTPAGELGPKSTGIIHLSNGVKSAFRMTEFNPPAQLEVGWPVSVVDHSLRSHF